MARKASDSKRSGVQAHGVGREVVAVKGCGTWWTGSASATKTEQADRRRAANLARQMIYNLVLDTDEQWGPIMLPWQARAIDAVLAFPPDEPGDEDFAARPLVWMDGPAGCGKDQIIAAVVLAVVLYAPDGFRVVCLSTDKERNADVVDTVKGYCRRDLTHVGQYVEFTRDTIRSSVEGRDVEVIVEACDGASASGARADLFILNEVQSWRDPHGYRVWTETIARYGKRGGRFAVFSNAPFTGRQDWRREAWETARVPNGPWVYIPVRVADCPWITPEYLEAQRKTLPESVFRRLFLCEPTDGRGELISADILRRCEYESLTQQPVECVPARPGRRVVGCDLGITRDHACVVALCLTPEQTVYLERVDVWVPVKQHEDPAKREVQLAEVEGRLLHYGRAWNAEVYLDPYQAVHMRQTLEAAGVTCVQVDATAKALTEMAEAVMSLFRDGRIRLFPHAGRTDLGDGIVTTLGQQLLDAELKEQERGVRITSKRTRAGHGDQAAAFALAALGIARLGVWSEPAVGTPVERAPAPGGTPLARRVDRPTRFTGPRPTHERIVTPWHSVTS